MKATLLLFLTIFTLLSGCGSPSRPVKIEFTLTEGRLEMNGTLLQDLPTLAELETHLGKPRSIEGLLNNLHIWDKQGLCLFQDGSSGTVKALHISMTGDDRENRPQQGFPGALNLLGRSLDQNAMLPYIRQVEAFQDEPLNGMMAVRSGDYLITLHFKETETLHSVEISR